MAINFSVFLSNLEEVYDKLPDMNGREAKVFTSFHVEEEIAHIKKEKLFEMTALLKKKGYKILADVSVKNYEYFGDDFFKVAGQSGHADFFRIDYGFSSEQILEISSYAPICINASGVRRADLELAKSSELNLMAMHNYYPRTETGLDIDYFEEQNALLRSFGIEPMVFISGDLKHRGPIYDGLPSVETYRYYKPYVAYLFLTLKHGIKDVFVGDGIISDGQLALINDFDADGVITLPVEKLSDDFDFYDRVFTIREDSPAKLLRIAESRVFSRKGRDVAPKNNNLSREKGSITLDNIGYSRYTGELMIVAEDRPADERINLIAKIDDEYLPLLELVKRGSKIRFVEIYKINLPI